MSCPTSEIAPETFYQVSNQKRFVSMRTEISLLSGNKSRPWQLRPTSDRTRLTYYSGLSEGLARDQWGITNPVQTQFCVKHFSLPGLHKTQSPILALTMHISIIPQIEQWIGVFFPLSRYGYNSLCGQCRDLPSRGQVHCVPHPHQHQLVLELPHPLLLHPTGEADRN